MRENITVHKRKEIQRRDSQNQDIHVNNKT